MSAMYCPNRQHIKVVHHQIIIRKGDRKHYLKENNMFPGIKELLEYYEKNQVDPSILNIGHNFTLEEYDTLEKGNKLEEKKPLGNEKNSQTCQLM